MPTKRKSDGKVIPVDAIVHVDKRMNLPTADAEDFVTPELDRPRLLLYPRRAELDPQLVWRGKDEQDRQDLEVQAPPIYIQEKIDARVLVENLRMTSKSGSLEPELTLFETFDGLDAMELVEFYQHDANWSNRMILGDSLNVMASLAEREALRGKVQMIYMDPPYGVKFGSNWQASIRDRDVKDGNVEDAAREVEQIKAFRDTWELGIHSYLTYFRDRLLVARDLLTTTGSVFVQIGDENVHLVRSLLDEVFGSENQCATIAFIKSSGLGASLLPRQNDYILWYAADSQTVKYRQIFRSKGIGTGGAEAYNMVRERDGSVRRLSADERADPASLPEGARIFRYDNLTKPGPGQRYAVKVGNHSYTSGARWWGLPPEGMQRAIAAGRVAPVGNSLVYVRYLDDFPAYPLTNIWTDTATGSGLDKVYVVQTPTKIIERCLLMTTDPGDLVIDPTCGSGTTAYVAEQWGRRWITVDTSRVALALARQRLMSASFPYYLLADSDAGREKEQQLTGRVVIGNPATNDVRHGFVYDRIQHVTLKSVANNPDIRDGMNAAELNTAIRRQAEYELLYDRPFEDPRRVRVSGPFTVESLSPHRSLSFAPVGEPTTERNAALEPSAVSFEDTILANLAKAGIQNGRRNERLEFESVEVYAGKFIQAVGTRRAGGDVSRIGVAVGPQYGTVGPPFIKSAAREAIQNKGIDLLCILGFAFDPTALGTVEEYSATVDGFASVAAERSLGRVPVLLVRMNADLVMGEDLKKTAAGNLFTVFGEPDIEISTTAKGLTVEIKGVDVYDPTIDEVRSRDTEHIALWMIDTAYNGESFFVRHCYFTGGMDPYKRLKTALKADIDEEAWASLYRKLSRPFPRPDSGKIAVKVINDYGDEVLKVFDV
jgi:adenine-specific DNA-methyltransferase